MTTATAALETIDLSVWPRILEGQEAAQLSRPAKWELLSGFLREYGQSSLAYATLQEGMEYFVDELGYISYISIRHPVFARTTKRIALSDPVCAPENYEKLVNKFLAVNPHAAFGVISPRCAAVLRGMGFKVNCIGYEPELPIQTYQTQGNWKELDLIKRGRNEARREGLVIKEVDIEAIPPAQLDAITSKWIATKKINDREIWIYARRPVFANEPDVRKFIAFDKAGIPVGFVFYDPMYKGGRVYGYSANISRCDEQRYGRLATAIHMTAAECFRAEGKEVLNLLLAPFVKLELGEYNDDRATRLFFDLSARFGNSIYNFQGLSFHKSKYRGQERPLYYASNSLFPSNDVYLAFLAADITRNYFSTLGHLVWGIVSALFKRQS